MSDYSRDGGGNIITSGGQPVVVGSSYWEVASDAVAAYMMPGQGDTPDDWTGNGHDGVWTGADVYANSVYGRAFSFAGSSVVKIAGLAQALTTDRSCFFRLSANSASSYQAVISLRESDNGGDIVYLNQSRAEHWSGATATADWDGVGVDAWPGFVNNTFNSLGFSVVSNSASAHYRNGVKNAVTGIRRVFGVTANTVTAVGAGGNDQASFWLVGQIAEMSFWDRVLSDTEHGECASGPEPRYTGSAPTLSATGVVDPDAANWDGYSNGTTTFNVEVYRDGSFVELIEDYTGGSIFSDHGEYTAKVVGVNSGGWSAPERQATAAVNYSPTTAPQTLRFPVRYPVRHAVR